MRRSEFQHAVEVQFGSAYGPVVLSDLALGGLGGRTAQSAIDDGVPARAVWEALCEETDVPASRRHGLGLREPTDRG